MSRGQNPMRRRLLAVGAGFVCGGAFISLLALAIGLTPVGFDVMRPGVVGGLVPVAIGLVLVVLGLMRR
jgi:hypothetical protein